MKIATCVLLLFLAPTVFAQSNLAGVNGLITDPSTKVVPGAEVRVVSADTGAVRTAYTGPGGQYEIPGLSPGEYTVEVRAKGFALIRHSLRMEVGQNARLDLPLSVGEASTSIDVGATAETLKTEDASLGEVV